MESPQIFRVKRRIQDLEDQIGENVCILSVCLVEHEADLEASIKEMEAELTTMQTQLSAFLSNRVEV